MVAVADLFQQVLDMMGQWLSGQYVGVIGAGIEHLLYGGGGLCQFLAVLFGKVAADGMLHHADQQDQPTADDEGGQQGDPPLQRQRSSSHGFHRPADNPCHARCESAVVETGRRFCGAGGEWRRR